MSRHIAPHTRSLDATHKHIRQQQRRVQHLQLDDGQLGVDHALHAELPLKLQQDLFLLREQRVRLDVVAPPALDHEQRPPSAPVLGALPEEHLRYAYVERRGRELVSHNGLPFPVRGYFHVTTHAPVQRPQGPQYEKHKPARFPFFWSPCTGCARSPRPAQSQTCTAPHQIIQFLSKETKRSRETSQEWQRKGKIHFPCMKLRKRVTKKGREHKEKKNGESNQHLWNSEKREANNRNDESELRNPSPSFSQELQWQIHFPSRIKSHEESTCEPWVRMVIDNLTKVITSKDPVLTFTHHIKLPCLRKGQDNLLVNSCACVQAGG